MLLPNEEDQVVHQLVEITIRLHPQKQVLVGDEEPQAPMSLSLSGKSQMMVRSCIEMDTRSLLLS